jgi:hypothetical protein
MQACPHFCVQSAWPSTFWLSCCLSICRSIACTSVSVSVLPQTTDAFSANHVCMKRCGSGSHKTKGVKVCMARVNERVREKQVGEKSEQSFGEAALSKRYKVEVKLHLHIVEALIVIVTIIILGWLGSYPQSLPHDSGEDTASGLCLGLARRLHTESRPEIAQPRSPTARPLTQISACDRPSQDLVGNVSSYQRTRQSESRGTKLLSNKECSAQVTSSTTNQKRINASQAFTHNTQTNRIMTMHC